MSETKAHYYKWYPLDFARKTRHLSNEARWVYRDLLDAMYLNGGSLPADPRELAHFAKISTRKCRLLLQELAGFFAEKDGQITQKRVTEQLSKIAETSRSRAEAGRLGGQAKAVANAKADAPHKQETINESYPESDSRSESVALTRQATVVVGSFHAILKEVFGPTAERFAADQRDIAQARQWLSEHIPVEMIVDTIRDVCRRAAAGDGEPPQRLRYFEKALRRAIAGDGKVVALPGAEIKPMSELWARSLGPAAFQLWTAWQDEVARRKRSLDREHDCAGPGDRSDRWYDQMNGWLAERMPAVQAEIESIGKRKVGSWGGAGERSRDRSRPGSRSKSGVRI